MKYLIGADLGTTNCKVIAFAIDGKVLGHKSISYPSISPRASWVEQDPDVVLAALIDAMRSVVVEQAEKGLELTGVCFSSAMHGLIPLDETGKPLMRCMTWADSRANEFATKLKKTKVGKEIYWRTGTPIHPMSPLCKLLWLKKQEKAVFQRAVKFVSIKEYVFFKFYGEFVIDHSVASGTGLFDIFSLQWNKSALKRVGISEKRLSRPVPTNHILRGMNPKYAVQMAVDPLVPFVVGAADGPLANLGTGAIKPKNAALTIGTSGAIRVISRKPKTDGLQRIFSYILTSNHFALGGAVNNGGIVLEWFMENFARTEILAEAEQKGIAPYDLMIAQASGISPGADGLIFLPYLLGERAPHWDANLRGVFFGINAKHTREHFLRAVLEGVILGLYDVGGVLEKLTGKIDRISVSGGAIASPIWAQILADVFGKKVCVLDGTDGSCLGAAIVGMEALGLISSIEEVEKFISIKHVIEPSMANHKKYAKNFGIFKAAYAGLKDVFPRVVALQNEAWSKEKGE